MLEPHEPFGQIPPEPTKRQRFERLLKIFIVVVVGAEIVVGLLFLLFK